MAMTKREQQDLEVAQMRVREMKEKIAVLFGDEPTNTFTSDPSDLMADKPLVPNARIKFVFPGNGNIIHAMIRDGWLEIMGNSRIEILPQASNVIQISVKD